MTAAPRRGARRTHPLARMGFTDPPAAAALLAGPVLALWRLPVGEPVDDAAADVIEALARAADPDLAVRSLHALVDTDPAVLSAVRDEPTLRDRLIAVLGTSIALGQRLVARPPDWRVLGTDGDPTDSSEIDAAGTVAELRSGYGRALLAVAGRDLTGQSTVDEVAGWLSDLAGAVLRAAVRIASGEQPEHAARCRLAVIAMGKCGGCELNYVSDVDVIFVAEPAADSDDADRALRAATALAARVMAVCEQVAWVLDAALRPEGRSGPLVRTVASHVAYYRRWARTWEFQALLKARPVAGDAALGEQYCAAVRPLVWSASERDGFVPDVQAMRRRVEETLPVTLAGRELKLGRGGLRDVEFAVQLLQLVHGRGDPSLRSGNTQQALAELAAGGYVGRKDAAALAAAYRFLRTAEHRLQLRALRRTHLLPEEPAALRWLGRSMGLRPDRRGDAGAVFTAEHAGHARQVRRLHEKLFYRPLLSVVAPLGTDELRLAPDAARARLTALGFASPDGALRTIAALTSGVSRRAAIQRTLLPALLGAFADAPDPDGGLLGYRRVSEALGATHWYLRLLRDEGVVAQRLVNLLGTSRYVADLLVRAPDALHMLADDSGLEVRDPETLAARLDAVVTRNPTPAYAVAAIRAVRRGELLRTAAADLEHLIDADTVGAALSAVADATVGAALQVAARARPDAGDPPGVLSVVAMGRLGGWEAGYSSDVDAIFVYEPFDPARDRAAADWATGVVNEARRLLGQPAPDPPITIDADLRPEGRSGPLVRSLAAYREYYQRWSAPWEAEALLRARPLAGDRDLGARFIDVIDEIRYPSAGLSPEAITAIRRLKARVERERLPRGADPATHTKLGRGGLTDVEWTVQLLQLRYAGSISALRTTSTVAALRAVAAAELLPRDDVAALEAAWRLATRVRNATMLVRGRGDDQLPRSGTVAAGVMAALGYPPGREPGQFVDDYLRATRRARRVVETVFAR